MAVFGAAQPAKAILIYNIYERGSDVVIEANGSIVVSGSSATAGCTGGNGRLGPAAGLLCTGAGTLSLTRYNFVGQPPATSFGAGTSVNATSVSGTPATFSASASSTGYVALPATYLLGSPIRGESSFANRTLSGFGITATGLLGTWTLDGAGDTVQVFIGAPASVPGPLPLLGAGAAFGFSRRLRRRVSQGRSAAPSATSISV